MHGNPNKAKKKKKGKKNHTGLQDGQLDGYQTANELVARVTMTAREMGCFLVQIAQPS